MNNTKQSKKQLKKQKAKQKTQQSLLNKQQQPLKNPQITIKYCAIPQIKTQQYPIENQKFIINVKNKKINILEQQINQNINTGKKIIQIVAEQLDIPKAISLAEIIKRKIEGQGQKYLQNNILGKSQNKKTCMKISLKFY